MEKEKKYNLIEQFLDGSISEKERADFEKEIQNSDELKAEIQLHRELAEVTGGAKFNELRDILKHTDANWQEAGESKSSGRVVRFSFIKKVAAAAAIVLFSVLAWNSFNTNPATSQELFASNFEPYKMVLSQRSTKENSELLNEAISNYSIGDFAKAEEQFAELAAANSANLQPIMKMYQGVSALAVGHYETAILNLKTLLNEPQYQQQATWYLGLAYLGKNDSAKAKKRLEEIKSGQFKFQDAQKILLELDSY